MQLHALGGIELAGVRFNRVKLLVLLCYLALEGPKERRFLAELFWPAAANPMNCVAKALVMLRAAAPGAVESDGARVWVGLETDVERMLSHLDKHELGEGVGEYRGAFLAGVRLDPWPVELEEWVLETREFLAGSVQRALLRLGEAAARQGSFHEAADLAERAYRLPGAQGPEIELLEPLHLLLLAGESALAKELAKESETFGLRFASSAAEARSRFGEGLGAASRRLQPATSFVGREAELGRAGGLLGQEACRLLTLTGAGGSGKTRLALELARIVRQAGPFQDGTHLVPLDAVRRPESLPQAIAGALDLRLGNAGVPLESLCTFIGQRRLLLVLDNFEQLVDEAPMLLDLLERCANLKLLVTSRERLNLAEEWVLPVDGLSLPPVPVTGPQEVLASEAGQLFVERARQANAGFGLTRQNAEQVARICHLLDGSPLGLELAAVWTRLIDCEELAQEIELNLDILSGTARNQPDRHRSIRATFEHSWSLLSERERQALRSLGVFRGGFDRRAAAGIAGGSLPLLASLLDKSLVKAGPDGRYDLHPLIRHYAREKLAALPEEAAALRERHGRHYINLLDRYEGELWRARQSDVIKLVAADLENLRAAWLWAVSEDNRQPLRRAAQALTHYCDLQGSHRLASELLQEAIDALEPSQSGSEITGLLMALRAWSLMCLGDPEGAGRRAERALELVLPSGDEEAMLYALVTLGSCAFVRGEYAAARRYYHDLLACAQRRGEARYIAPALCNLAEVELTQGNYPEAERLNREAVLLLRRIENHAHHILALAQLGSLLRRTDRPLEALPLLQQAWDLARQHGTAVHQSQVLIELAEAHFMLDRLAEVPELCREAMDLAHDSDLRILETGANVLLGRLARAQGDPVAAGERYLAALESAWGAGELPEALMCLARLAEVLLDQGDGDRASQVLAMVLAHPAADARARDCAREAIQSGRLVPPAPDSTGGPPRSPELGKIVSEFLTSPA